ncbi:MAG: phage tail assembly chaperone [Beijerinckiaceae bacterium]|nr:phage tail assembly chaperone [Beijerinckiaceae bacterium]
MKTEARPRTAQPAPPPFPWREAMAFGFGVLRLNADAFWSLTPRELASAVAGAGGGANDAGNEMLSRSSLDALMRAFPDEAR